MKTIREKPFNVLFWSRIDAGGKGFRPPLFYELKREAEEQKCEFTVGVGGMINIREISRSIDQIISDRNADISKLKQEISDARLEISSLKRQKGDIKGKGKKAQEQIKTLGQRIEKLESACDKKTEDIKELKKNKSKKQIADEQIEPLARLIDESLPLIYRPNGKVMKHYIVTSHVYDGPLGVSVVKRLVQLRRESGKNDVIYQNAGNPTGSTHHIKLKGTKKTLAVVVPNKGIWRSDFYSTAPDRYTKDEVRRTAHKPCDIYVYGCGSSALNRRDGENPFQRITLCSLCKLEDTQTVENMIGVRILKFVPGQKNVTAVTVPFKDLVSSERHLVKIPTSFSNIERLIFEELIDGFNLSIGLLDDRINNTSQVVSRAQLENVLNSSKMKRAGLIYDQLSDTYDFNPEIFRKQRYNWPKLEEISKETVAAFGCPHIGSIHTHYQFITQEFCKALAVNRVTTLLALGDIIEGLEHDLNNVGEIVGGMDYTTQEEMAALLIAELILNSLDLTLRDITTAKEEVTVNKTAELSQALVEKHLMNFYYWVGNHDDWPLKRGVRALITFDQKLRELLRDNLNKILTKNDLPLLPLGYCHLITDERVKRMYKEQPAALPSGMLIDGAHYYARRSMVSSAWAQKGLKDLKGHSVYLANFHVADIAEEWSYKFGLRASFMLPTLKSKSRFEFTGGKVTDFGAVIHTYWLYGGRGLKNEVTYIGNNPNTSWDNDSIYKFWLKEIKAGTIVNIDEYFNKRLKK